MLEKKVDNFMQIFDSSGQTWKGGSTTVKISPSSGQSQPTIRKKK